MPRWRTGAASTRPSASSGPDPPLRVYSGSRAQTRAIARHRAATAGCPVGVSAGPMAASRWMSTCTPAGSCAGAQASKAAATADASWSGTSRNVILARAEPGTIVFTPAPP